MEELLQAVAAAPRPRRVDSFRPRVAALALPLRELGLPAAPRPVPTTIANDDPRPRLLQQRVGFGRPPSSAVPQAGAGTSSLRSEDKLYLFVTRRTGRASCRPERMVLSRESL